MSTPITMVAVQVEITAWTPPPSNSSTASAYATAPYTAVATMVVGNDTKGISITNNVITITAPTGTPVQINFNAWSALPGYSGFMVGAPYKEITPSGASTAEYSIVLVDRGGLLTGNGNAQWTYNGTTYTLAPIPVNGMAVIDLNDAGGKNQQYTFNLTLMDSNGRWGIFDPGVENEEDIPQ